MVDAHGGFQFPLSILQEWLTLAGNHEPNDPNAAALATADRIGTPSVRMVLVKSIDHRGLHFYTNSQSRKGIELGDRPTAAMCFHWKTLRKQIRIEGDIERLSTQEASSYFHSRSRGSQIAAAVSLQSRPLASRDNLETEVRAYTKELAMRQVPVPGDWAGYVLKPHAIEFWRDGVDRLHHRLLFKLTERGWQSQALYP